MKLLLVLEACHGESLDIGSGSGFLDPLFAELAGETSIIVGVDHVEELRKLGETNMRKSVDGATILASVWGMDEKDGLKRATTAHCAPTMVIGTLYTSVPRWSDYMTNLYDSLEARADCSYLLPM